MKAYWIYFTDTKFWDKELCVTVYADNAKEAIAFLNDWIIEQDEGFFENINTSRVEIFGGKTLRAGVVKNSWE